MASLSYDYRWNPIQASFNEANSLAAKGYESLSNVGNIFTKLADSMAEREAKRAELSLRERQLNQANEQFLLGQDMDRAKLEQAWKIAQMDDAVKREANRINERKVAHYELSDMLEQQEKAAKAKAMLEASSFLENRPNEIRSNISDINKQKESVYGRFAADEQKLAELNAAVNKNQVAFDAIQKDNYSTEGQGVDDYPFDTLDPTLSLDEAVYGANSSDNSQAEAKRILDQSISERDKLRAMLENKDYQASKKSALETVRDLDIQRQNLEQEEEALKNPFYQNRIFNKFYAQNGYVPKDQEIPLEIRNRQESNVRALQGRSNSSNNSGNGSTGDIFRDAINSLKSPIRNYFPKDFNFEDIDGDNAQMFRDRVVYNIKRGISPEQAVSEAASLFFPSNFLDSKKIGVPLF